ncbi:uncharacterized protein N7479_004209 [Penicillium vulpinum]|uniref:Uncharacterized protein n=1 Tax=Penicillium vulpinum TaxID=29845 RepID=A0A1V6SCP4_9EURO|nr:uncharacterized protein N7479_004209 [Penicillium vulpinum]KAJ5964333.1 hypothetical protein N7479_004209 [Penicillium vulpinum]OQE11519.1 hypothetical protein PENVUL_c002G07363 [Penicillium vulpinum]
MALTKAKSQGTAPAAGPAKRKVDDVEFLLTLLDRVQIDYKLTAQTLGIEKSTCRMRLLRLQQRYGMKKVGPTRGPHSKKQGVKTSKKSTIARELLNISNEPAATEPTADENRSSDLTNLGSTDLEEPIKNQGTNAVELLILPLCDNVDYQAAAQKLVIQKGTCRMRLTRLQQKHGLKKVGQKRGPRAKKGVTSTKSPTQGTKSPDASDHQDITGNTAEVTDLEEPVKN